MQRRRLLLAVAGAVALVVTVAAAVLTNGSEGDGDPAAPFSVAAGDGGETDGAGGGGVEPSAVQPADGGSEAAAPVPTTATTSTTAPVPANLRELQLLETITGDITPKSVVASPAGLFVANNMMYSHTVTVYDRDFRLVATISDEIDPARFGLDAGGALQGSPVEAAITSDGRYAYVSNYQMYGDGYGNAGGDSCDDAGWDDSFVYRIDLEALAVDQVIPVGAVPKYVALTPDDATVLVTNWCSFDMSVVDAATGAERGRVELGRHPRGIAVDPAGIAAYVAVMGSTVVERVDLATLAVSTLASVGANPRHVVMAPDGSALYVTLNGDGTVAKVAVPSGEVLERVATGAAPRSMAISDDGQALYVVNYNADTVSKVLTDGMVEVQELPTGHHPIGVAYDAGTANVWVANYSGSLQVFADRAPSTDARPPPRMPRGPPSSGRVGP